MRLSRFFIDRPIFAAVLSIVIFIAGLIAMLSLPVSEYPEVVPPSIVVRAIYPGANPRVLSEAVATPLEEQINGVENMLYMSSQATSDGVLTLTVTFRVGTDVDLAQVQVQNRVSQALPRLPDEVRQLGVTTVKSSPNFIMVVHLVSPDHRYNDVYLRNYGLLQIKDVIARIPGIGQVQVFGGGDYAMRIWLDPGKVAARGLTAGDVVSAIREQNVQVAAGVVGAPPMPVPVDYQLSVNARGRLVDEKEFGDIVLKTGADGEITRLRDVGRIELAAGDYALRSLLDNQSAVGIGIFQAPGSNALQLSSTVRATMEELKKNFPEGVQYRIVYDPTINVRDGIREVVKTLFEAILLVVFVVVLFLQTWRASIIPLVAVPISIVGTFAILLGFGFSINTLSLFGLVLAIGIVVDDAIVVVENVERNIEAGLSPRDASYKAMEEVSGPIIAIALVLCAVFVPVAFLSGLTGEFYRQFALTIAFSTVISAVNSLTLSPALSAILLKSREAPARPAHPAARPRPGLALPAVQPGLHPRLAAVRRGGGQHPPAERHRARGVCRPGRAHGVRLQQGAARLRADAGQAVPRRLRPAARRGDARPHREGHSRDGRHRRASSRASRARCSSPASRSTASSTRRTPASCSSRSSRSTSGTGKDEYGLNIAGDAQRQVLRHPGCLRGRVPAPAGQRPRPGRRLQAAARGSRRSGRDGAERRHPGADREGVSDAASSPALFSSYRINVPQLEVEVDREKVKQEGISLTDLFQTMQVYLGSVYANDFNRFGRTYQVKVQADAQYRATAENIAQLKVRNAQGADGAARLGGAGQGIARARPGAALQRLPRGRHQRRPRARLQLGPGGGGHRGGSRQRCCRTASATSGPTSATSSGCPATRRSSSSRSACCSRSWCSRRSTRAGRCRSRSS